MYKCEICGAKSIKWVGKCPECHNFNSMVEINEALQLKNKAYSSYEKMPEVMPVSSIGAINQKAYIRFSTKINEFDSAVGSGIVPAQSILIGGDPGIGKSTLMLQVANSLACSNLNILYISTEESLNQLLLRAKRLKTTSNNLFFLSLTEISEILYTINNNNFDFIIIDSIQRVSAFNSESAYGSPNSLRQISYEIINTCLKKECGVFLVGHVTKEGLFAGPKTLEHMVDTVLYFDSSKKDSFRVLRCYKNRFGSTNEIGIFEMSENGLAEVKNIAGYFIDQRQSGSPGSVITACLEGTRAILVEVQALTVHSYMPVPKRVSLGIDNGRLSIIAAVLEKKEGIKLSSKEIYIKIAGGLTIQEPSIDLPLALAIISSYTDKPLPSNFIAFGEIGLTGEVRAVVNPSLRVREAKNLGFTDCILPEANLKEVKGVKGINLHPISQLKKIIEYLE
jgi:DNA repair protein RadA/Sms